MRKAPSLVRKLRTPAVARIVPGDVFDAFGWCESDTLDWRCASAPLEIAPVPPIGPTNPPRMVFVFHDGADSTWLPREYARLHAFGLGLEDEWALAPYAIDDATDELYARRVRPRDLFWLAADNLAALFWGLHDWAHFHNHGPFEQRAQTELQCDAAALAWLWANRRELGLDDATWSDAHAQVEEVARARFDAEDGVFDAKLLSADAVRALVSSSRVGPRRPAGSS